MAIPSTKKDEEKEHALRRTERIRFVLAEEAEERSLRGFGQEGYRLQSILGRPAPCMVRYQLYFNHPFPPLQAVKALKAGATSSTT